MLQFDYEMPSQVLCSLGPQLCAIWGDDRQFRSWA